MEPATAATPLQVHYQTTVEDWVVLNQSLAAGRRLWDRAASVLVIESIIVACCLPGTFVLLAWGQGTALIYAWSLVLVFNVFVLVMAVRSVRPPDPKILRPTTLILYPKYLEIFNDRGWERRDWSLVAGVQMAGEMIVILRDDGLVYAVPRRAFPSPEAADAFFASAERFRQQAQDRAENEQPAPWRDAAPAEVFANDTLQVTYSTGAKELREMAAGVVLQPVDAKTPPGKSSASLGWGSWALSLLAVLVMILFSSSGDRTPSTVAACIVFLLVTVLMIGPVFRVLRWIVVRRLKFQPAVTQTLTISPEGVSLWAPRLEARSAWESIDAVQENARLIVFSANRPMTVYLHSVPKSAFADPFEARHFVETAARYRQAAVDREEEQASGEVPRAVETGNPYQPPQAR